MTALFFLALATLGLLMKLVAMLLSSPNDGSRHGFVWTPLLAPNSLRRVRPMTRLSSQLFSLAVYLGATGLGCLLYWKGVRFLPSASPVLGYLGAPLLWLMTEGLVRLANLLWRLKGQDLPALHEHPARALSVADFWGNRWNLWFRDWFRYVIFCRLRRRPQAALILVFALSGLMHELVINVPLYWVTDRNLFGTMMVYFLGQAGGMQFERRWLKKHPHLRRWFTWLVVLGPAPLIINEGMLRVMLLWQE